jgi:ribosomal protein S18 acetylase RimI-like enzyme
MTTNPTTQVRDARQEDVALMARWAQAMALETEGKALDGETVLRGIQRAFDDPNKGRYFVADSEGRPAGMLMLTWEWSDWRDGWWWWIQSVYTAKDFRRRGVYRALYAHVLALAKADPEVRGIRLYVERENVNAMRTYEELGMLDAGYAMFETSFVDYGGKR